ncbi:three-helix bundle dimerization domain-containing protein [Microbacterium sp. A93]|uniref:three-helix bundle dimerization domain-containing protein n=1 Tax=Microbacterium sp. A93 TaxID=3450716 RepID=UPI003F44107A
MTTRVMTQTTSAAAQSSVDRPNGRHAALAPAPAGNGMNGALPTGANHILHAHVLGRAIRALQARYADLEPDVVRSTVNAAYRELDRTARLKTYLPTLGIRQAEDHLRRLAARPAEGDVMAQEVAAAA